MPERAAFRRIVAGSWNRRSRHTILRSAMDATVARTKPAAIDVPNAYTPAGHPAAAAGRIGVLLVNLGSPAGTDYWSMRRYLKEFLSDRRVIEVWRPLWWTILNLLRPDDASVEIRPRLFDRLEQGAERGRRCVTITRSQAEKLGAALAPVDERIVVDWAMRYGAPSVASRIEALKQAGCDRILVAPLYPQYAAATTATVNDVAFAALQKMRWQPALRTAAALS